MSLFKQVVIFALLLGMAALNGGNAAAAVTSKERRTIGLEGTLLTPSGAIRAGNPEGTIPEWQNKALPLPEGFLPGTFHPDPFAGDLRCAHTFINVLNSAALSAASLALS